jgi:hypothetical protein
MWPFLSSPLPLPPPDLCGVVTQVAGRLSVDLTLGRFVSYGVAVALSREAVIMAAALSLPKSPFRFPRSTAQSDPDEYIKYVHLHCVLRCAVYSLSTLCQLVRSFRPVCRVDHTYSSRSSHYPPHSPYLFHALYVRTAREGLFARSRLDSGHLSEPIMLLHALLEWRACESDKEKCDW